MIKLLKAYENLQNNKVEVEENSKKNCCGPECFSCLKKTDLLKLNMSRHKLISPLVKGVIKLGIEMFSYNPCLISQLFQSKT